MQDPYMEMKTQCTCVCVCARVLSEYIAETKSKCDSFSVSVVKTRLQSFSKGAHEETYNGVMDCVRYSYHDY